MEFNWIFMSRKEAARGDGELWMKSTPDASFAYIVGGKDEKDACCASRVS
jgi:hypothetical protein